MSYIDMTGVQENGNEDRNLEGGEGELPRPPISTYERILNSGLQPRRVYDINEVIEQTILLNECLRRDRRNSNIIMWFLFIAISIIFICFIAFFVMVKLGVICFC